tara:strand:+ start:101 stop:595 length:495 start_codon:yes stop_codon:yes gene_type:complete
MISENLSLVKNNDIDQFSLNGRKVVAKVVDIYDADTCKIVFELDNKLVKFNCRLIGIDTPEMKPPKANPNRDAEKKKAKQARNRMVQLCSNVECKINIMYKKKQIKELLNKHTKLVEVNCHDFDKYGRLLIEISDLEDSKTFNQVLIDEGFAYSYDGGTKKKFV